MQGRGLASGGPVDVIRWATRTLRADRHSYMAARRPLTTSRVFGSIHPSLDDPIFIIGAPRSGTTFLGECFMSLPEISYHHEPVATKSAARLVYERSWDYRRARSFYRQVYAWLMRIHLDGDRRFAEKTPRNCFLIQFLQGAFPDGQFVHIIRDGRDCALSHSKKPWLQAESADSGKRESGGYPFGPYARFWVERERVREFQNTTNVHRSIWAWKRHVESALESRQSLPSNQYFELRYETLVKAPTAEAERLLEFLRISNPISRKLFLRAVNRASPASIGRWRRELSGEAISQIETEAGHLLNRLGYTSDR